MRLRISALTDLSLARIRFLLVVRLSLNRPLLDVAQMCVNPRNWNVSGLGSPRRSRFRAAKRPNSISRVFSPASANPNSANLSRRSARNRSASSRCSKPARTSSAKRTRITSPARAAAPPLLGPQVKHVVQVNVAKQRRSRRSLRSPLLGARPFPGLDDACPEPFLDQAQDPPVRDPVLEKPSQPRLVKRGKEVADVRVEHPVHPLAIDPGR